MKKGIIILLISVLFAGVSYASDYRGVEKQGSIFQKLGDLITGKYDINGKPLKKVGIIQCAADNIKSAEAIPVK